MKKKQAFTLIELLAVIIILAVIALIATPIVMKVIESSKKSAAERSSENFIREVETESLSLRAEGTILNGIYSINENGNLCPTNEESCDETKEIKINMAGTKPSGGSVVISNGKVQATGTSVEIEDYVATISESGSIVVEKDLEPKYYGWIQQGTISDGLSYIGDKGYYDIYLGFASADGKKIDAVYVCSSDYNGTEYCLRGLDPNSFERNKRKLNQAFNGNCSIDGEYYSCKKSNHDFATISESGHVSISRSGEYCEVQNDLFTCVD